MPPPWAARLGQLCNLLRCLQHHSLLLHAPLHLVCLPAQTFCCLHVLLTCVAGLCCLPPLLRQVEALRGEVARYQSRLAELENDFLSLDVVASTEVRRHEHCCCALQWQAMHRGAWTTYCTKSCRSTGKCALPSAEKLTTFSTVTAAGW